MFLEDGEIRVSKLIKLWLAEGFLCGSLEEMVYVYLEVLVQRSLVYVRKRKSNGRIKSLSMHDLVREMCMRQALVESFFHAKGLLPTAIKHQRRVSICASYLESVKNVHGSTIRTMIWLEGDQRGFQGLFGYFRLLRILDLSSVYNYLDECDFPDQVFELFHLRYLAFSYAFRISEAISNFENLQTLIIHPSKSQRRIIKLLLEIWRMRQLSHLQMLKLRNNACIGETWETSEEGFSRLTFLLVDESNLKNWVTETSHFPRLKSLVLHRCRRMWEVPHDIGEIQTLELIQVDQRNKTLLQSAKQIQQDRQSLGNDSLEIRLG